MFKHILVPTDGSPLSQDAARSAVKLASEIGARITAVYAMQEFHAYYVEGIRIDESIWKETAVLFEKEAQAFLDVIGTLCHDAGVSFSKRKMDNASPYEAIIEAAGTGDCDLIFMASHGRKGLSGLLLGSETNKVLTHSKIPVLVYR